MWDEHKSAGESGCVESPSVPDGLLASLSAKLIADLQRVVEMTVVLAEAGGAAVAYGTTREMVCVASAGDTAPPIGAKIDPSLGLARDCVTRNEFALCADTTSDVRVDHEACRSLSIASLIYVPICVGAEVIGILGAFSTATAHFSDADVLNLHRIAERISELLASRDIESISFAITPRQRPAEDLGGRDASPGGDIEVPATSFGSSRAVSRTPLIAVAAAAIILVAAGWVNYQNVNSVHAEAVHPFVSRPVLEIPTQAVQTTKSKPQMSIVIDPGHGGRDIGTTSRTGLREKDLTLDIAARLGAYLRDRLDCRVVFTRTEDEFVSLEERVATANASDAGLLISIHGNSSSYEDVRGIETFYFGSAEEAISANDPPQSDASGSDTEPAAKSFAEDIQTALLKGLRTGKYVPRDRGVKPASFVVLRGVQIPAVLAEISFLSSDKDAQKLDSAKYRDRVAEALYKGIANHLAREKHPAHMVSSNEKLTPTALKRDSLKQITGLVRTGSASNNN